VAYRRENQDLYPDWFNGPAPSFGDHEARLLVVGLAPGRKGANRTGRPFTGDFAGTLLYDTLIKYGFATGKFEARPDDSLKLIGSAVTNAVRCAPPGNKPETSEENNCRPFLTARLEMFPNLKAIVTLGDVSRRNLLKALGLKASAGLPGHGTEFQAGPVSGVQQLSLLAAEHEHRAADDADVRGAVRAGEGVSGQRRVANPLQREREGPAA
jgi:uracil-DNA glycosylase family 4